MKFVPHEFTALVRSSPLKASRDLSAHYAAHGTATAVATQLGVCTRTLTRWLQILDARGFPVRVRPRRGWPLGKPRGSQIALNLRGRKKVLRKR